jgi:hypothetical protein
VVFITCLQFPLCHRLPGLLGQPNRRMRNQSKTLHHSGTINRPEGTPMTVSGRERRMLGGLHSKDAERHYMDSTVDSTEEFWQTTWEAWRSGALAELDSAYELSSTVSLEKFKKKPDTRLPGVKMLLRDYLPLPGEFLIREGHDLFNRPWYVLTSLRLIVRDRAGKSFKTFMLSEIQQLSVVTGWKIKLELLCKDDQAHVFDDLLYCPGEVALRTAIGFAQRNVIPIREPTLPPGLTARQRRIKSGDYLTTLGIVAVTASSYLFLLHLVIIACVIPIVFAAIWRLWYLWSKRQAEVT